MTGRRRRLALLLLSAVVLATLRVPASQGQEAAPAVVRGPAASASATVAAITPGVGALSLGTAAGVSLASLANQVAQAQAEFVDAGIFGAIVFGAADVDPDLDGPIKVDNRAGDRSEAKVDQSLVEGQLVAGERSVAATTKPSSSATSVFASAIGPLVDIDAGRAEASTEAIDAGTREARAVVTTDLRIAGVIELSGLRWSAVHRSGGSSASEASFEIGAAAIGGVPVPTGSTAVLGSLINLALAPTGLVVDLPVVERLAGADGDIVRITPLGIRLQDSPLGQLALGPVLDLTREDRERLFDDLSEAYGPAALLLLGADIGLSILGGQGFVEVEVGGAEASSGEIVLEDPFGTVDGGGPAPEVAAPAAPVPVPAGVPAPITGSPTTTRPASVGPLQTTCSSTHAERPHACDDGDLLPLGLAVVGTTAAVGGVDLARQRRRRAAHRAVGAAEGVANRRGSIVGRPWQSLRPYGALAAAGVAFAVLSVVVAVPREEVAYAPPATVPDVAASDDGSGPSSGAPGAAGPVGSPGDTGTPGRTGGCADRALQVPGDPYSPPCYSFTGDNGGATAHGVTRDTIKISVRDVPVSSATEIFVALAGQEIQDASSSQEATLDALAEYFSRRFQFYGRKLDIDVYEGTGDGLDELFGGGKEEASADAVQAAKEIGAFADISAGTLPYADGLAQQGVVNIGAPYPSRRWFDDRAPYSWSLFPDGSNIAEATQAVLSGRVTPGSVAEFAGGDLQGRTRKFGVIVPENLEYQESVDVFLRMTEGTGIEIAENARYKLDLVALSNQASNLVARMKNAGVTTLLCFCDPAMLALGMAPKAVEQGYYPEWLTAGLVFVDQDVVSQAIDPRVWERAFGTAYNAASERLGSSYPYAAYKSVRPDDEPAVTFAELYYQLYLLSIGIQMAGPNLTPETFQAGLYAYPDSFGPRGTWNFGPNDHTAPSDYRELWWDPDRQSEQNDEPGTWVELNGGKRYTPQSAPKGRAPFFEG